MGKREYQIVKKHYKTVDLSGTNTHSDYWYKKVELTETKCEKVERKWIKVEDSKPLAFSLVDVRDTNGKGQNAWWTGSVWQYGRKRIGDIVEWRKMRGDVW